MRRYTAPPSYDRCKVTINRPDGSASRCMHHQSMHGAICRQHSRLGYCPNCGGLHWPKGAGGCAQDGHGG